MTVEEAIREYKMASEAVDRFVEQNNDLVQEFIGLLSARKSAEIEVKNRLKAEGLEDESRRSAGGFRVYKRVQEVIDPAVLAKRAPNCLSFPGVVKKVDREELERLEHQGLVSTEVLDEAVVVKESLAVKSPKKTEPEL